MSGYAQRVGDTIDLVVYGDPAPQGSKRPFRNQHTGRIQQVESSQRVAPWRDDIRAAIHNDLGPRVDEPPRLVPFAVHIVFVYARPQGHYRAGRYAHLLKDGAPVHPIGKKNDVDKLARAVLDAISSTGAVWHDDGQVVRLTALKRYVGSGPINRPGARIVIRRAPLPATLEAV